MLFLAKDCMV